MKSYRLLSFIFCFLFISESFALICSDVFSKPRAAVDQARIEAIILNKEIITSEMATRIISDILPEAERNQWNRMVIENLKVSPVKLKLGLKNFWTSRTFASKAELFNELVRFVQEHHAKHLRRSQSWRAFKVYIQRPGENKFLVDSVVSYFKVLTYTESIFGMTHLQSPRLTGPASQAIEFLKVSRRLLMSLIMNPTNQAFRDATRSHQMTNANKELSSNEFSRFLNEKYRIEQSISWMTRHVFNLQMVVYISMASVFIFDHQLADNLLSDFEINYLKEIMQAPSQGIDSADLRSSVEIIAKAAQNAANNSALTSSEKAFFSDLNFYLQPLKTGNSGSN